MRQSSKCVYARLSSQVHCHNIIAQEIRKPDAKSMCINFRGWSAGITFPALDKKFIFTVCGQKFFCTCAALHNSGHDWSYLERQTILQRSEIKFRLSCRMMLNVYSGCLWRWGATSLASHTHERGRVWSCCNHRVVPLAETWCDQSDPRSS